EEASRAMDEAAYYAALAAADEDEDEDEEAGAEEEAAPGGEAALGEEDEAEDAEGAEAAAALAALRSALEPVPDEGGSLEEVAAPVRLPNHLEQRLRDLGVLADGGAAVPAPPAPLPPGAAS
ncbi:unnamed protein product, partial [Prorocentrum cordatum]